MGKSIFGKVKAGVKKAQKKYKVAKKTATKYGKAIQKEAARQSKHVKTTSELIFEKPATRKLNLGSKSKSSMKRRKKR